MLSEMVAVTSMTETLSSLAKDNHTALQCNICSRAHLAGPTTAKQLATAVHRAAGETFAVQSRLRTFSDFARLLEMGKPFDK